MVAIAFLDRVPATPRLPAPGVSRSPEPETSARAPYPASGSPDAFPRRPLRSAREPALATSSRLAGTRARRPRPEQPAEEVARAVGEAVRPHPGLRAFPCPPARPHGDDRLAADAGARDAPSSARSCSACSRCSCAASRRSSTSTTPSLPGATTTEAPPRPARFRRFTNLGNIRIVVGLALVLVLVDLVPPPKPLVVPLPPDRARGHGDFDARRQGSCRTARPTLNPAAASLGPSFPSGHSATAAAFYAAAALVIGACAERPLEPACRSPRSPSASRSRSPRAACCSTSIGCPTSSAASHSAGPGLHSALSSSAAACSARPPRPRSPRPRRRQPHARGSLPGTSTERREGAPAARPSRRRLPTDARSRRRAADPLAERLDDRVVLPGGRSPQRLCQANECVSMTPSRSLTAATCPGRPERDRRGDGKTAYATCRAGNALRSSSSSATSFRVYSSFREPPLPARQAMELTVPRRLTPAAPRAPRCSLRTASTLSPRPVPKPLS